MALGAPTRNDHETATTGGVWHLGQVDLLAASAGINVLSLAMPLVLLQVYDRIVPNEAFATLALMVIGVIVALSLEAVLTVLRAQLSSWSGARFEHRLGVQAVDRLLRIDLAQFERTGAGVHLDRMTALGTVRDLYTGQGALALADLPFAVLFLGLIAYLAGWLVLVPLVLLVIFGVAAWWTGRELRKRVQAGAIEDERRFNFILEVLSGIHTVKALGMETLMLRRYERLIDGCGRADFRTQIWNGESSNFSAVIASITLVAMASVGAAQVINGSLTVGGLAACSLLASRCVQPIQRALGLWLRLQSVRVAEAKTKALFADPPDRPVDLPALQAGQGKVMIDRLSFRYSDDGPWVLKDLTLHLQPGEAVGITGEAGSGKTTLLWLLLGMLQPTGGRLTINDQDPRVHSREGLSHHIAYLPQQAVMFEGTILENIAMFREGDWRAEAVRAARMVGLDHVIGRLPQGWQTRVGTGAIEALPRGITQRIAIARALVDRPKILLFDAANMALDSRGDEIVRELMALLKGKLTMVLVTQRPSLLRVADRVLKLDGGALVPAPLAPPPQPTKTTTKRTLTLPGAPILGAPRPAGANS